MGKAKATLDTNILISAFGWEGPPKMVFKRVIEGKIELVMSDKQFDELSRVLEYPKFKFTKEQRTRFEALILEVATFVKPAESITVVEEDPDDNRILEAAVAGKVDYIITGDSDLLNLKAFRGAKIVTPNEFLQKIS